MARSMLLLGGSGFLGKCIAQEALQRGWRVVSVSRHAEPQSHSKSFLNIRGDALDQSIYDRLLTKYNIDTVVHSVGVLFEGRDPERSYERVNRDSALIAAVEAEQHPLVKTFAYISASRVPIFSQILQRYTRSKIETENALLQSTNFRPVIVRPGMLFGRERAWTVPLAYLINFLCFPITGLFIPKCYSTDHVASVFLDELERERHGPIVLDALDDFVPLPPDRAGKF